MWMGQRSEEFVSIIVNLQESISPVQQVCSIICGKRSGKICRCTALIQGLLEKLAEKILSSHIKRRMLMWSSLHCFVVHLNSRDKNVRQHRELISHQILQRNSKRK